MQELPIMFYQSATGTDVQVKLESDTIWLSEQQMAQIFGVDRSVIGKHIRNVIKTGELEEKSVCAFFAHTAEDGKTYQVKFYNLDMIISVGYRVNSSKATQFRKRATQVLKDYMIQGYALNHDRLKDVGLTQFRQTIEFLKQSIEHMELGHDELVSINTLILDYAGTRAGLYQYDAGVFDDTESLSQGEVDITAELLTQQLHKLKTTLMADGTASDLFAQEKYPGSLDGIVGNIYQSYDGQDLYPTPQSKAAHLLYFVVKDHPFDDGNKRSGAFLFVLLLQQYGLLYDNHIPIINDLGLTALTLLIAQSNPKDKELIVALIQYMITR